MTESSELLTSSANSDATGQIQHRSPLFVHSFRVWLKETTNWSTQISMLLPSGSEGRRFMSQHRVIKTHHFYCHKSTEPPVVADAGRITTLWGP